MVGPYLHMSDPKPPRRKNVIELLGSFSRAMHTSEIAQRLGVGPTMVPALSRVLDDLVFDGTVVAQAGQRFRLAAAERSRSRDEMVEGYLTVNPRGFGFVQREGDSDDVFIPAESLGGAMHGDRVRARVVARGSRGIEGAVSEVLVRRSVRIAGPLSRRGKTSYIYPDDTRIRGPVVLPADTEGNDGDIVIVEITRFPETPDENPEGKVTEVLGPPGTPDVEVRKLLAVAGVIEPQPELAVAEARAFGTEVADSALAGREDLTPLPLPTIDPEDARDHDDAVWAVRTANGYRVWIAIADVSHYVAPGTALDASAKERGCSIYLPDRAIPMLPRELSSNLCSLLPDVVRLCLAVEIDLDHAGTVLSSRLLEGFMRSRAKLTYEGVARALGMSEGEPQKLAVEMKADLEILREISSTLRTIRMRRGALDFDLPESKILVDQATKLPIHASKRAKDPGIAKAYQIVEELMLLANETVAQFVTQKNVPAIFRNHAAPDPEKIARFASICQKLGIEFDEDDMSEAKRLSAFVKRLKSHPSRSLLDTLLVRSLKQAVYDVANIGHFGLASDAYLHFTSPIRRYPDLVVHRAVRAVLRGQKVDKSDEGIATMREAAQLASERERRAMQVERDVADLYGVFLMREKIGEQFTGSVSGIVGSGVFVTLDDPFVNVLVRSESLGQGPYEPDDDGFALVNSRTGDRIDLGDVMLVQIVDTSIERRTTYATRVSEPGGVSSKPGTAERPAIPGGKGRKGDKPGKDKKGSDKKEGGRRQKSFGKPKKSDKPAKKTKKDTKKPSRAARKKR